MLESTPAEEEPIEQIISILDDDSDQPRKPLPSTGARARGRKGGYSPDGPDSCVNAAVMGRPKKVRTPEEEAAYQEGCRTAKREAMRHHRADPERCAEAVSEKRRRRVEDPCFSPGNCESRRLNARRRRESDPGLRLVENFQHQALPRHGGEIRDQISDSDCTHTLTDVEFVDKITEAVSTLKLKGHFATGPAKGFVNTTDFVNTDEGTFREALIEDPRDYVLAICYTSGTTGQPKGAVATHYGFLANIATSGYVLPCKSTFLTRASTYPFRPEGRQSTTPHKIYARASRTKPTQLVIEEKGSLERPGAIDINYNAFSAKWLLLK
ncbi:hypothetical protein HPB48_001583 [Haemaphysalis longicornis]|uniref:AMP-dependent synthetase/ligase domain-containing protein n=1 Tax=Haemaphysalis longicornis TaxID=44386 RepID=A0A9J6G1M2_HAELO|nr:hypothetical protein HPB48_001583 [Haemaphysalis longicornis]